MAANASNGETTQYSFEIDSELWSEWKDQVPRSKYLDEAIIDLIKQDLEKGAGEDEDDDD